MGGCCGGDQVDRHIFAPGCDNDAVQGPDDSSAGRPRRAAPVSPNAAATGKETAAKTSAPVSKSTARQSPAGPRGTNPASGAPIKKASGTKQPAVGPAKKAGGGRASKAAGGRASKATGTKAAGAQSAAPSTKAASRTAAVTAKDAAAGPTGAAKTAPLRRTGVATSPPATIRTPVPRGARPPSQVPVVTPSEGPNATRSARRPMPPPGQIPRRLPAPQLAELDRTYIRGLRRAVTVLLILGLFGFMLDGSNRPANPRLVPATDAGAAKGAPAFGSATLTVTSSRHRSGCVLEAVTATQQQAGLMGRTTVAPYAGMAFIFGQLSTQQFWMRDTVIPLSIAWFDAGGRYEKSALMKPCPPQTKACPTYGPGEPFESALEVPAGKLKNLGIGAGSTVSFGGACT
jgi:uncharacterized membrane protein (UPF0127 family)